MLETIWLLTYKNGFCYCKANTLLCTSSNSNINNNNNRFNPMVFGKSNF